MIYLIEHVEEIYIYFLIIDCLQLVVTFALIRTSVNEGKNSKTYVLNTYSRRLTPKHRLDGKHVINFQQYSRF